MKVKCLCINNKNKPNEVLMCEWISENMEYHIIHIYYHPQQGIEGVLLEEVKIKSTTKYESYRMDRFAFTEKGYYDLIELMKLCTELNNVDINKLLEESKLEKIEI